ncbi:DUF3995 domain-containing protein [Leptospira meyeri]|uniref:DUF3995 domain-containing protein n=1 Tax=Leptospira meyeri TaxID=29508 RepID=UPI00223E0F4A|nr:DUF3995 domain-containing protein [Leptospira meyeri]MCW7488822.1 DUF3995 domain-containing protein [Leptospira meyeri]
MIANIRLFLSEGGSIWYTRLIEHFSLKKYFILFVSDFQLSTMIFITATSSLLLLSISTIHIYWGFGGLWPGKTKQELIDLVFGKGDQFPSRFMCLIVAFFLALFGMLPIVFILRIDLALNSEVISGLKLLMATVSAIFFLRSALGYFPFITKHWKSIFVYYTKRIYNPLCFIIGLVFLIQIL